MDAAWLVVDLIVSALVGLCFYELTKGRHEAEDFLNKYYDKQWPGGNN